MWLLMIIVTLIFTLLSAFAYRAGGMSKEQAEEFFPWFPQFLVDGWFRDFFCSLIPTLWALIFLPHVAWYWYFLALVAQYGCLTTYFDDVPPKGVDKFGLHGLTIGLGMLFITIPAGMWILTVLRAGAMSLIMFVICKVSSNDFVEEFSRGGIISLTLPLLLI